MPDEPPRVRRRIDYLKHVGEGAARERGGAAVDSGVPTADPRFPGWVRKGEYLYRRRLEFPGRAVDLWDPLFSPEADSADHLVFYDTETTGLSGGAGSLIFLFGAAWCKGHDLRFEQLFLSDFPGEPEFLQAVQELLRPFSAWVSYNGKTFDSHLLRSRFLMNGMTMEPGPQVDLLHHARRLWRSITGDCSLKAIERAVLGVTREMDVAGEDIPLVWLQFLRTGAPGILPAVFEHNLMDITSVARLYGIIGSLLRGDLSETPVDEKALGGWLLDRSPDSGAAVLAEAFRKGDLGAGAALSLHHKRRGEWDRAVEIWETLLSESRSIFAAVELAKHLEHRARDLRRALDMVETIAAWGLPLGARDRQEIRRRRERLQRKLARGGQPE
ncbi:MAG TPA: ribonuclease H-like domain-containing protein [Spirochaetia bacterium]|nr:ribonuclease H-like domain-containing protein [Spirochaetia bacterium]